MATATLCRSALRRTAAPITLGLSTGLVLAHRQHQRQPMRLDALPATRSNPTATSHAVAESDDWLDPELIRQLSGGSLAGFLSGLVVSVFSKTLVLLTGLAIVTVQVSFSLSPSSAGTCVCNRWFGLARLVTDRHRRWPRGGASTCSPRSRSGSAYSPHESCRPSRRTQPSSWPLARPLRSLHSCIFKKRCLCRYLQNIKISSCPHSENRSLLFSSHELAHSPEDFFFRLLLVQQDRLTDACPTPRMIWLSSGIVD